MRKIALALAGVAALSITAPAHAAVVTTNYGFTGSAGSGTFTLSCDNPASFFGSCTLDTFDFMLGSTLFTTVNTGIQRQVVGLSVQAYVIGGTVSGVTGVNAVAGADDFFFALSPSGFTGTNTLTYFIAGNPGLSQAQITISEAQTSPVPEPATWAMMLLGFGVIGFEMRRRNTGDMRTSGVEAQIV
jgi:hypothetical protein